MNNYVAKIQNETYRVGVDPSGEVVLNNETCAARLESIDGDLLYSLLVCTSAYEVAVEQHQEAYYVTIKGNRYKVLVEDERRRRPGAELPAVGEAAVTSPMPGVISAVLARPGQAVQPGDDLVILEAMKMENEIKAPFGGLVERVHVKPGQTINQGDLIAEIGLPQDG
jgi:biotin carboxyl carrier protein